jgi:hypothetical protein
MQGEDSPPPFPGMPKPGGKMVAQDAALKRHARTRTEYFETFAGSNRIGQVNDIPIRRRKMLAKDAALHMAAADDFAEMFPDTRRIGLR